MDILIIIAIVAIAVLLTGLTDLRALRRPFQSKSGPDESGPDAASDADAPAGGRTGKKQQKRST